MTVRSFSPYINCSDHYVLIINIEGHNYSYGMAASAQVPCLINEITQEKFHLTRECLRWSFESAVLHISDSHVCIWTLMQRR